jgi:hypothetical protein
MNHQYLFFLYSAAHAALLVWALRLRVNQRAPASLLFAVVAAGLVYDNFVVAVGSYIGVGEFLEFLSWPRFILHALVTPFTMVGLMWLAEAGGAGWAQKRGWKNFMWVFAIVMVVYGSVTHLIGMDIYPACFQGVLRYSSSVFAGQECFAGQPLVSGGGFPIPSVATAIVALIVGIGLWRQRRWPWLIAGALLMFVAGAMPIPLFGMVFGNGGEVLLLTSYIATSARFVRP